MKYAFTGRNGCTRSPNAVGMGILHSSISDAIFCISERNRWRQSGGAKSLGGARGAGAGGGRVGGSAHGSSHGGGGGGGGSVGRSFGGRY